MHAGRNEGGKTIKIKNFLTFPTSNGKHNNILRGLTGFFLLWIILDLRLERSSFRRLWTDEHIEILPEA